MNVARHMHSSCILGNSIYVFCGIDVDYEYSNCIERLYIGNVNEGRSWELINHPLDIFPARVNIHTVALNDSEILIFGGHSRTASGELVHCTQGIFILNSRSGDITTVKKDESNGISILSNS